MSSLAEYSVEELLVATKHAEEFLHKHSFDILKVASQLSKVLVPSELRTFAIDCALARKKAIEQGRNSGNWLEKALLTRHVLEQATHPHIARFHAQNFTGCQHVLEICTGAGFDTAELATVVGRVTTIEADAFTASMARHNLSLRGIHNVEILEGRAEELLPTLDLFQFDGVWSDPARRTPDGRRVYCVDEYFPPLSLVIHTAEQVRRNSNNHGKVYAVGIKISPLAEVDVPESWSKEWIGFDKECREQVLVCRSNYNEQQSSISQMFSTENNTVALFSSKYSTCFSWKFQKNQHQFHSLLKETLLPEDIRYLVEPQAALIRSGGLPQFFSENGLSYLDRQIAYGVALQAPPFSQWYEIFEIIDAFPYRFDKLSLKLQEIQWGRQTEIKKRGIPEDPDILRKKLKLPVSADYGVVIITKIFEVAWCFLAQRKE